MTGPTPSSTTVAAFQNSLLALHEDPRGRGRLITKTEEIVAALHMAAGMVRPDGKVALPVDLDKVANLLDAALSRVPDPNQSYHGRTNPTPYGFLCVGHDNDPRRLRFTLAHELGHTFFFDRNVEIPRRLPLLHSKEMEEFEEKWCDKFASGLLMPRSNFQRPEAGSPPSLKDLLTAARAFEVSPQTMLIRIFKELNLYPGFAGARWTHSRNGGVPQFRTYSRTPWLNASRPEANAAMIEVARSAAKGGRNGKMEFNIAGISIRLEWIRVPEAPSTILALLGPASK